MKKNVCCIAIVIVLFALCFPAQAQQPKKVPRIGYLSGTGDSNTPGPNVEALRQGLEDLGYIEGKNILVEYRYIEGKPDRYPGLVAELVQLKVDVLVSSVYLAIRVAKQATSTIPIVMVTSQDPVATGLIDSLARPGGNVTGLTLLIRELSGKRLELLKEAVPRRLSVGVLGEATLTPAVAFEHYETAARALKIPIQSFDVSGSNPDFEGAFQAVAKRGVNAVVTLSTVLLLNYPKRIAEVAIKNRLPSMFEEVTG